MSVAPLAPVAAAGSKKTLIRELSSLSLGDVQQDDRVKRDSIAAALKKADPRNTGQIDPKALVDIIEESRNKSKENNRQLKFISLLLVFLGISLLGNFLMIWSRAAETDSKIERLPHASDENDLTVDGNPVKIESSTTFVSIADLPTMPIEYSRSLDKVSYLNERGTLEVKRVEGFSWQDANTMSIDLVNGNTIKIAVDTSVDTSTDDRSTRIATLHRSDGSSFDITDSEARRRRRLAACEDDVCPNDKVFSSLADMKAHVKRTMDQDPLLRRRLSTGTDALFAVYAFFGGIAEGSISAESIARAEAVPDAEESVIVLPNIPTVSKWDISTYDADSDSWQPGTWYLDVSDVSEPKFRVESVLNTGTLFVEEVHGGSKFSYQTADAPTLIATLGQPDADADVMCPNSTTLEAAGTTCADYVAAMMATEIETLELNAGRKEACSVHSLEVDEAAAMQAAAEATVQVDNGDGSGVFSMGGWFIKTDTSGNPIELVDGETTTTSMASITAITEVTSADGLFDGCNEGEDDEFFSVVEDAESRRQLRSQGDLWDGYVSEERSNAHDLVDAVLAAQFHQDKPLEEMVSPRLLEAASTDGRKLGAWTRFQAWASGNTKWCGAGTDLVNTPCPDNGADYACHRHDHGKKTNGIIGGYAVRLGCDIDRGLAYRTDNWAVQAVFGRWGLAMTWGCYDLGRYRCWNWKSTWWGGYWRYGNYCKGEHTHYGPWRYSSYSHSYGWNPQSQCSSTLPFCTGCI